MATPAVGRTWEWDDAYVNWLRDTLSRFLNVTHDLVNLPPGSPEWCGAREEARALLKGADDADR